MILAREAIKALIPHQGSMCLWDEVTAWDAARIRLRTHGHRDPANPLRSDARLRAVHLCEYGAQAMAVHGGLRARADLPADLPARQGLLVALREVRLHVARADDLPGALEGEAEVLADAGHSQQYAFRIVHAGTLLAEGRAAVMFRDGLAAPADAG